LTPKASITIICVGPGNISS